MTVGSPAVEHGSRLVVGLWQLSDGHQSEPLERATILRRLDELVEAGFTTFDCADIYTGVEETLGEFLAARRAGGKDGPAARVHTKFVPDREALGSLDRGHVERIVDRSLKRLGVERLDLVQFAWWDYSVPGYVEAAGWLDELRRAGKVAQIGVTNFDASRLGEIIAAGVPLAANQVQYSLLDRRVEGEMADLCVRHGIELLCYGALAGGFLTDRHLGAAAPEPPLANRSLTKYGLVIEEAGGWTRFQQLLALLHAIAAGRDATIAQVALSWLLDRPGVGGAIVGFTRPERLLENARSLEIELSGDERASLDAWATSGPMPAGPVFGFERDLDGPHAAIMRYNLNRLSRNASG